MHKHIFRNSLDSYTAYFFTMSSINSASHVKFFYSFIMKVVDCSNHAKVPLIQSVFNCFCLGLSSSSQCFYQMLVDGAIQDLQNNTGYRQTHRQTYKESNRQADTKIVSYIFLRSYVNLKLWYIWILFLSKSLPKFGLLLF